MGEQIRPEVLISRLTHSNEAWRVEAEARLIAMGAPAVEPLMRALRHAHPSVRVHAVRALAKIGDGRGIQAVIGALSDGENRGAVAIAAEKAVVAWGTPAKPALIQAAKDGSEAVRARAIRALGKIGGDDLVAFLQALLQDALPSIRTQAAVALAEVARESAIPLISPLLEDSDKWVRYGVAEALVGQGCVRGEAVLQQAKADEEEQGSYIPFWAEELLDKISDLKREQRAIF